MRDIFTFGWLLVNAIVNDHLGLYQNIINCDKNIKIECRLMRG